MASANSPNIRSDAFEIIKELPEDATWDDLMYRIYVRQCVESGMQDAAEDRVVDVEQLRLQFGLKP